MQKRIYGIETEYGIIFTPEGRKTLPGREGDPLPVREADHHRALPQRLPRERRALLPGHRLPSRVRDARVRVAAPADRLRQGRRADPRRPAGLRRGEDPRGAHRREALDLQEQHRLRRQQLRLPRELPRRPRRRLLLPRRAADPVPGHAPDLHRRRARSSRPRTACTTASASARSTSTRRSRAPRPTTARSSTRATSRTPTARSTAGCT